MKMSPFSLVEFSYRESGSQHVNLLGASIDHRVIASAGINQGPNDTSSGTDSMGIDSLVIGARKKCKTTVRAVYISSANEEERNNIQLEHWSKRKLDVVGVIAAVVGTLSPRNSS